MSGNKLIFRELSETGNQTFTFFFRNSENWFLLWRTLDRQKEGEGEALLSLKSNKYSDKVKEKLYSIVDVRWYWMIFYPRTIYFRSSYTSKTKCYNVHKPVLYTMVHYNKESQREPLMSRIKVLKIHSQSDFWFSIWGGRERQSINEYRMWATDEERTSHLNHTRTTNTINTIPWVGL